MAGGNQDCDKERFLRTKISIIVEVNDLGENSVTLTIYKKNICYKLKIKITFLRKLQLNYEEM